MDNKKGKGDRRFYRLLIYPRFQLALVAVNATVLLMILFAARVQVSRFFSEMSALMSTSLPADHAYFQFLVFQEQSLHKYLGATFVVGLLVSALVTIYLSFKLAGPIFRLRSYLARIQEYGDKEVVPFRFRGGDFYSDLPQLLYGAFKKVLNSKESRTLVPEENKKNVL